MLPARCRPSAPVRATPCETIASGDDVSAMSAPAIAGERRTAASSPARERGLESSADPALGNAARRDDRCAGRRAVARRCHKHGSRDRRLGSRERPLQSLECRT